MKYMISAFDESQIMALPWAMAGFKCICVDLQAKQPLHENIITIKADMRYWWPPIHPDELAFFAAFAPCTNMAVSGARWFTEKGLESLHEALELVIFAKRIAEYFENFGVPWMIENPVSTLSSYWRKPDFSFNPCDYGDPYTKKTCLWTGGGLHDATSHASRTDSWEQDASSATKRRPSITEKQDARGVRKRCLFASIKTKGRLT